MKIESWMINATIYILSQGGILLTFLVALRIKGNSHDKRLTDIKTEIKGIYRVLFDSNGLPIYIPKGDCAEKRERIEKDREKMERQLDKRFLSVCEKLGNVHDEIAEGRKEDFNYQKLMLGKMADLATSLAGNKS